MANKDFKVKNKLVIAGLTNANGVLLAENHAVDSHTNLSTQYGGTGTTTSPNAGQVLYSTSGSTYAPTTLADLVTGAKYQADAPTSPAVGQIWIESDSTSDSFDPNLIRRQAFTATAGQTIFTTSISFIEGYEQVYFNGLLLLRSTDYTTSGGNTVTLTSAAAVNDIIEVVTITNLNSTNTYTQAEIDSALSAKLSTSTAASTYLTQSNASSTYLTQSNASSTYLTQSNASSTYLTQSNASSTYLTQSNASSTYIPKNLTTTTGDIIYASSANTPARLAIGSSNQVLTVNSGVPAWSTLNSGGWTLLYTVTTSGAAAITQSVDFTGYRQVVVEYENVTCGNTWNLQTKLNNSSTDLYAQTISNNTTALVNVSGSSFFQEGSGGAQKTGTRLDAVLNINNPSSTSTYKSVDYQSVYTRNTAGDPIWTLTSKGFFRSTSAITSIVFDSNATNFTGGTVRIYGVK
jgi:hypothetical protein